jgi:hypothetical protein
VPLSHRPHLRELPAVPRPARAVAVVWRRRLPVARLAAGRRRQEEETSVAFGLLVATKSDEVGWPNRSCRATSLRSELRHGRQARRYNKAALGNRGGFCSFREEPLRLQTACSRERQDVQADWRLAGIHRAAGQLHTGPRRENECSDFRVLPGGRSAVRLSWAHTRGMCHS